ncbi:hypothetical protein [Desulfovermiculus halophilus]|jgi:hypothetical protein|uniref:hypothetical protein n=1 Tax=Desulfovermiculus halophilus TaxID=339722 RepID=UPI000553FE38|nr:hypothetical protein [Desulfovermiculus halophilus]
MQAIKSRLREIEANLSPEALTLWLEFGDFLRQRDANEPTRCKRTLRDLAGGLENADALSGDPVTIQEKLRNEWN